MNERTPCTCKLIKESHCPVCHSSSSKCNDACDSSDSCDCSKFCDCCDVRPITSCMKKLEGATKCVFECLEMHPSWHREVRVAFCILLTEISAVNDKLECIAHDLCKLLDPCREETKEERVLTGEPDVQDGKP